MSGSVYSGVIKPKRFIVAQRTGAEVEKPGNVAYGKQLAFIQEHASFPRRHDYSVCDDADKNLQIGLPPLQSPIGSSVAGYIFRHQVRARNAQSATPEMLWINEIIDLPQAQK